MMSGYCDITIRYVDDLQIYYITFCNLADTIRQSTTFPYFDGNEVQCKPFFTNHISSNYLQIANV